jgi:hypothetical protein
MKQVLIGLSPIYTTQDKELTVILIMFKIAPLHGRQLSEEFHWDQFRGPCFLLPT